METNQKEIKCMFLGPSGIGKTTLAHFIADQLQIPFLSGSYSDLVPKTKEEPHAEMISKPSQVIYTQEHTLLNERNKLYKGLNNFVTDRSYIDSLAYFIFKISHKINYCETEAFETLVKELFSRDCTHLIIMQCTDRMIDTWDVQGNEKRVTNTYFQWQISNLMMAAARRLGMYQRSVFGHKSYVFKGGLTHIKILVLDSRDIETNKNRILKFLGNGKK